MAAERSTLSGAYSVEVLDEDGLSGGGWYEAWTCTACNFPLTVASFRHADKGGPISLLSPTDGQVRIICPSCSCEHRYAINGRKVVYIEPADDAA